MGCLMKLLPRSWVTSIPLLYLGGEESPALSSTFQNTCPSPTCCCHCPHPSTACSSLLAGFKRSAMVTCSCPAPPLHTAHRGCRC